LNLKYLLTPVSGTVFDLTCAMLQALSRIPTPVLKVVPDDALTAKVFISNQDIGFVKKDEC